MRFISVLKTDNKSLYDKLMKELQSIEEGLAEIENVKATEGYSNLSEEDQMDEALISYLGKLAAGNMTDAGDISDSQVARVRQSMLTQFKNWLRRMFNNVFRFSIFMILSSKNFRE